MNNLQFNVCKNTYYKGGQQCEVKSIEDITSKIVNKKEEQDWLQCFYSGYRVDSSNIDWNYWNGCVFIDIDSKHYYNDVNKFNIEVLYDGLLDYLQYNYYNVFYNIHTSWSGSSYHIIFYFDVDKNENNFKKCCQYAQEIIYETFSELGAIDIIKYNHVLDKCVTSYYQGLFFSNKKSDFGFIDTEDFGKWCEIDEYELKDKYSIKQNYVNKTDLTNNFSLTNYNENNNSIEAHHRTRMSIYMTLVAIYRDKNSVDEHWLNICNKHIFCPKDNGKYYKPLEMYKESETNHWYGKFEKYTDFVDIDLLKKFGYEFEIPFIPQNFSFYEPNETIEMLSSQHLSDIQINFKKDKINHIFAGCGFGKTYWAKELSKNNRVCVITPLRSISKDSFENTNFIILDEPHKDEAIHILGNDIKTTLTSTRWSICTTWESFVAYELYHIKFDYVIMDEVHTLSMYDYRLNSINDIKMYFPKAKGIKIIMTGTPSNEIKEFDCYTFKIIKEQPKVKCEILAYNNSYIGWVCNDIKEWIKQENNYAVIFKDTANYKDIELLNNDNLDVFLFNSNYEDNVNELLEKQDLNNKVTMISVYGQAGINIWPSKDKCIRIYIFNNNGLAAIQYANRIRNKKCIDKVIIPVKKDTISNNIENINFDIDVSEAENKIKIINSTKKSFDNIFDNVNKQKLQFKYGFTQDCLDKIGDKVVLNIKNYKLYELIKRTNNYEKQMQVLYNRLIQNDFTVKFNYLQQDVKRNKETKFRNNVFAGQMINFDKTQIHINKKTNKLYIMPTKKLKEVTTGDLLEIIEGLLNALATTTIDYYNSFNNIIANVVKETGSITKSDIKRLYDIININNHWENYYDNSFIYIISDERWDDYKIAAAVTRSMYNDISKNAWKDIADEMYDKIKYLRKTLSYIKYIHEEIFIEWNNPHKLNIENDDITKMIYTYIVEQHTKGKKNGKKIMFEGVEYDSIIDCMNKTGKSRNTIKKYCEFV